MTTPRPKATSKPAKAAAKAAPKRTRRLSAAQLAARIARDSAELAKCASPTSKPVPKK
jgi:hypothetical protein